MIDFRTIISSTTDYNFHTHTQYCDGRAPMTVMAAHAAECGMRYLGFSPHSPINFESPCNMSRADVGEYLDQVRRLKMEYDGKMEIFAGMEIDYTDEFGPSDSYFQHLPLDYRIGSIHFIPSKENPSQYIDIDGHFDRFKEKMHTYFDDDIEWVVRSFYNQSTKMVEAGGFDVMGHFDKIGHNASQFRAGIDDEPWYDKLVMDLFDAIMDHHYVVEINTKAYETYGRLFPSMKYWGMLKRYDVPVLVNSDAHEPTLINAGREATLRSFAAI